MIIKTTWIITLLLYFSLSNSAVYIEESTQKQIDKSDLIIRGTVDSISVDLHDRITFARIFNSEDGTSKTVQVDGRDSIATTFKLKLHEVLYGDLENKEFIEVEMDGGCYGDSCLQISTNYNLVEGEEYVLLLFKDETNNIFKSTSASYSVFKVDNEKELIRLTDSIIKDPYKSIDDKESHQLRDLNYLKQEIQKYKDNGGLFNEE